MDKRTVEFTFERETKNKVRYQETEHPDGLPDAVGALYLEKWFVGRRSWPHKVRVTIEEG